LRRYGHSKLSKMAAAAILNLFDSKIAPLDPTSPKTPHYNQTWSGSDHPLQRYDYSRMLGVYGTPIWEGGGEVVGGQLNAQHSQSNSINSTHKDSLKLVKDIMLDCELQLWRCSVGATQINRRVSMLLRRTRGNGWLMSDNGVHGNHTPGRDSKQCLMWLKGERSQRERERERELYTACSEQTGAHQARVLVVKDSLRRGRWGGSVSLEARMEWDMETGIPITTSEAKYGSDNFHI